MIKGEVTARAVALQDLMSDLKVLDKKKISLGVLQLDINEQTKRTLEEEIEQKHKSAIETNNKNITTQSFQKVVNEQEEKDNQKEEKEEERSIDGADDLII